MTHRSDLVLLQGELTVGKYHIALPFKSPLDGSAVQLSKAIGGQIP